MRRFLEALGVPPGSQPPPPVRPSYHCAPSHCVASRRRRLRQKRSGASWAQPLPPLVTTPEGFPPPYPRLQPSWLSTHLERPRPL